MSYTLQPWSADGGATRDYAMSRQLRLDGAADFGGQNGAEGAGSCDEWGPDSFNGARWQRLTMVLQWYSGVLRFFVFDGLHALAELPAARAALLGGFEITDASRMPTPGDERVHLNLWQVRGAAAAAPAPPHTDPPSFPLPKCNWGGVPDYGRRTHVVVNGFDFSPEFVDLAAAGITVPARRLGAPEAALPPPPATAPPVSSPPVALSKFVYGLAAFVAMTAAAAAALAAARAARVSRPLK